jgi:hypothetical protein
MIFLIPILLFNCASEPEVPLIVQTSFEPLEVGEFGVTVQQSSEHSSIQFDRIKKNTLHHRIPDVPVLDLQNGELRLPDLINKPTFILTADSDCGIGLMYMLEFFPEIWNRPMIDKADFDVICLVKTYGEQTPNSIDVIEFRDELDAIYDNTFIISEENALKMNAMGGVLTHFVDQHGVVKYYGIGSTMSLESDEKRFDYILSLLNLKSI